jgi:hypothetical protein
MEVFTDTTTLNERALANWIRALPDSKRKGQMLVVSRAL